MGGALGLGEVRAVLTVAPSNLDDMAVLSAAQLLEKICAGAALLALK